MKNTHKKKRSVLVRVLIALAIVILIGAAVFGIYISQFYHASDTALAVIEEDQRAEIEVDAHRHIVFAPEKPVAGLIFYPGGKVQYEAYAPLLEELAAHNVLCVLVHMPGNLAVLDLNAADGIREEFPEIKEWYIGGHSLGGSMAAVYVAEHHDDFKGLALLGSYSTSDLTDTGLKVVSIYGSNDGVLNREKYEANSGNLPENTTEYVIEGGNHANFGDYGEQDGDGRADISAKEQITTTAEVILDAFGLKQ